LQWRLGLVWLWRQKWLPIAAQVLVVYLSGVTNLYIICYSRAILMRHRMTWYVVIVGKWDGAVGNQPKECIKGVSEETEQD